MGRPLGSGLADVSTHVFGNFASGLKEIWRVYSEKVKERKAQQERARIAAAFNDRYTFVHEYVKGLPQLPGTALYNALPRGGYAWMCPECNKIHHPQECSVFSGLQYPGCCTTPYGNRHNYGIAMGRGA